MKRVLAVLIVSVLGITGCGYAEDSARAQATSQQAAPAATATATPTATVTLTPSIKAASSPSQLASAVAKIRPLLQESFDGFDDEMCLNVMSNGEKGLSLASCTGHALGMKRLAEALKIQLESLKPWPAETQTLAEETVRELTSLAAAVEIDIPSMIDTSALFTETTLRGWDPYL